MSECGINPQTGRCVNNGRKNTRDCTRDLKTKRCRKKQQPKKQPKTPDKTEVKKCKEGYMLNPATKRCISKTGNVAKKIQVTKDTTTIGGPVTISYYEIEFGGITKKFLLFGDLPDMTTIFGTVIVVGMGIYALHREQIHQVAATPKP